MKMKQQEKVGFKKRAKSDQCCQTLQKSSLVEAPLSFQCSCLLMPIGPKQCLFLNYRLPGGI